MGLDPEGDDEDTDGDGISDGEDWDDDGDKIADENDPTPKGGPDPPSDSSRSHVPLLLLAAAAAADGPLPLADIVAAVGLAALASDFAAQQSKGEPWGGYNQGKKQAELNKSKPTPSPPGKNPTPPVLPPDNEWKKFLDKLGEGLHQLMDNMGL